MWKIYHNKLQKERKIFLLIIIVKLFVQWISKIDVENKLYSTVGKLRLSLSRENCA